MRTSRTFRALSKKPLLLSLSPWYVLTLDCTALVPDFSRNTLTHSLDTATLPRVSPQSKIRLVPVALPSKRNLCKTMFPSLQTHGDITAHSPPLGSLLPPPATFIRIAPRLSSLTHHPSSNAHSLSWNMYARTEKQTTHTHDRSTEAPAAPASIQHTFHPPIPPIPSDRPDRPQHPHCAPRATASLPSSPVSSVRGDTAGPKSSPKMQSPKSQSPQKGPITSQTSPVALHHCRISPTRVDPKVRRARDAQKTHTTG
ncbi:hypothetical protein CH63R_09232 [Colletotrichum higginsianum IMI 349063]|uniref:Uncharacterized protein n=1 Tax=Colletotrichum higginsianum (strain IMI 349063) TaxID=759273 RepID=A0A1B7Y6S1_COLHI|nr:hypothetical protein CH63R_09232 [Colletotrichum higginsianum IMI 349063]OBR07711.1 hypothetical protein CH63R_09232 [Colletotrichum higginsianum IMI 349063]